jgi:hypothetical protein
MRSVKSTACENVTTVPTYPQPIRAKEYGDIRGSSETVVTVGTGGNGKKLRVGVNDAGRRVGESHQNAKLSDDDVRLILELHSYHGLGYGALAKKFEASKATIQKICNGSRRAKAPVRYR